jgi:hypothetical protein
LKCASANVLVCVEAFVATFPAWLRGIASKPGANNRKSGGLGLSQAPTGPAFSDFLSGSLPANTGRKMSFTGTTVLKLRDGKIIEEIGLDDGVTALEQLGLIRAA